VLAIVRTLEEAVRAGRPETSHGAARLLQHLDPLVDQIFNQLVEYLDENRFLRLQVRPQALRYAGSELVPEGSESTVAPLLHSGDVVELLFKQGVSREELVRFVEALHRSPFGVEGLDSVATHLWGCELESITFRCRDEYLPVKPEEIEAFDLVNAPVERPDELTPDVTTDPAYSAATNPDDLPVLDLDQLPKHLRPVMEESEENSAALASLSLPDVDEALGRLSHVLVGTQVAEEDAGTCDLARDILLRVVDLQLEEERFIALRNLMRELRMSEDQSAVRATLDMLADKLCADHHVIRLGAAIEAAQTRAADAAVVREIIELLGDRILPKLWSKFVDTDEEEEAREPMLQVLATGAVKDPQSLARRVDESSWNEVRDMVILLGRIGGPRVVPSLGRWKYHEDSRVRMEVVRVLTTNTQPSATTMLCDMVTDPDHRVRKTAVWSLATRRDPRAIPRLKRLVLDEELFRQLIPGERDDILRAYGRLADEPTLLELADILRRRQLLARGWKAELRRSAAIALGESRWPQARELLEKHANSRDGRLRAACRDALRAMNDAERTSNVEMPQEVDSESAEELVAPDEIDASMVEVAKRPTAVHAAANDAEIEVPLELEEIPDDPDPDAEVKDD
jgi:HEAT repeat protein